MRNYLFILWLTTLSLAFNCSAESKDVSHLNQSPATATSRFNDSVYVDMGIFYGSDVTSKFITWWPDPVSIDQTTIGPYLNTFFTSLIDDGVNEIKLAFAQLCDIDALESSQMGTSQSNTITQIFQNNYPVGSTTENFLKYFNASAHSYGLKVSLSFGGEAAQPSDMTINGDPSTEAKNLISFLKNYWFDSVDFDIEGSNVEALLSQNSPSSVLTFFQVLHENLPPTIQSILTLEGGLTEGPSGPLAFLFSSFNTQFDGVNLMLYSDSQYYIDANNVTWGIKQWMQFVPDLTQLHIGFYDSVAYENPNSSAGTIYPIPDNLTRGQAAAFIYQTLLSELGISYSQIGKPFWWTDNPANLTTDTVLSDFYHYLNQ